MAKPKLIDKWKDKEYGIITYVYQYSSGLKLVLSVNPASVVSELSIISNCGSFYEEGLQVPDGTAHFFEHLLFADPNDYEKTNQEANEFRFGTPTRPSISGNAYTNPFCVALYGSIHHEGISRLLTFITHQVDRSVENLQQNIPKQREIILSEESRLPKPEKNEILQMKNFFLKDTYPEEAKVAIGTAESIKEVEIENILLLKSIFLNVNNTTIAIQTREMPTPQLWKQLEKLADNFTLSENKIPDVTPRLMENTLRVGTFQEEKMQSFFCSFNYQSIRNKKIDYSQNLIRYFTRRLMEHVMFEVIREELHLVYEIKPVNTYCSMHWYSEGFRFKCQNEKAGEVMNALLDVLQNRIKTFLFSTYGKNWLNGEISNRIFQRNISYDSDYADSIAKSIMDEYEYKVDRLKVIKAAKKITAQQIWDHFENNFLKQAPHIWAVGDKSKEELESMVKDNNLYRYFETIDKAKGKE